MKANITYILLAFIGLIGCTADPDNPFDDPHNLQPTDSTALNNPDPSSFAGLHQRIFRPTCANAGCHDGTFEPDFRTIESAYNTLVYHGVVKNDPSGSYQYRVKPGSLSESILWLRLNEDIDGISGIMPLDAFYDPESEWNANKSEHLTNISDWITAGALDVFGNAPNMNDRQPGIAGIYAEADGQPCEITERIGVPIGSQTVTIWFALHDNETAPDQFESTTVKVSGLIDVDQDTLAQLFPLQLQAAAQTHPGFLNEPVEFMYRFSFSTSSFPADSTYYMRVAVKDPQQPDTTWIPQQGSQFYIKRLFSWKYVP